MCLEGVKGYAGQIEIYWSYQPICGKSQNPDPPILAFLEKARVFPQKARVFLFAEPLKSLEKRGKTHKKARKIRKRKKQGNRKKQGLEGEGGLVAQCSATPATVAATPPCSATHLFRQPNFGATPPGTGEGGGATPKFLGGVARHRCYTCKTL